TLAVGQERRPHRAHRVAAVGRLDLEDLGAHVGEQHRAVRPREHPREVEHAHALEEPHRRAASSAARTRAGVIGSSVKRTPTSWAETTRRTRIAPVASSTSSTTAWAAKPYVAETLPRRSLSSMVVGGS